MANICELNRTPDIKYPTFWEYKLVFGKDDDATEMIKKILVDTQEYKIDFSRQSKNGNYQSYNVSVFVKDEKQRLDLFAKFKEIAKYVL